MFRAVVKRATRYRLKANTDSIYYVLLNVDGRKL